MRQWLTLLLILTFACLGYAQDRPIVGRSVLVAPSATATPLTVDGVIGQTAPLAQWRAPSGVILSQVLPDGTFAGPLTVSGAAPSALLFTSAAPGNRVSGAASTSYDLANSRLYIQNNSYQMLTIGDDVNVFGPTAKAVSVTHYGKSLNAGSNEYVMLVEGRVEHDLGSTGNYEKIGILAICATSDPSRYTAPTATKDCVGTDTRGTILAGNAAGRAWGLFAIASATSDGLLVGAEIVVENAATDQSAVDQTNSKVAISINNGLATVDATAALYITLSASAGAGANFHHGIIARQAAFVDDFISLLYTGTNTNAFQVTPTGKTVIGESSTGTINTLMLDLYGGQEFRASTVGVSDANTGRLRYNVATQTMQMSLNTGAYVDISAGLSGSFTTNGAVYATGAASITSTAGLTDGQLLVGSTGLAPVAATLTAGTNITIANTAGGITISAAAGSSGTGGSPSVNDFRLTLATGYPAYAPQPATGSSVDTGTEILTFAAAHEWVSGTIVTVSATSGGLTAGTRYYINAASTTTVSFHTNVADSLSGASKVNLTGMPAQVRPSGVSNTTVYYQPHKGNSIGLYDGSSWSTITSSGASVAVGTTTSGTNYDVFAYNNAGVLTLETLAWTSDTARATALVRQDGIWVKTGATTRRYVGTYRTDSTTTTIDDAGGIASQTGGKRFLWNASNRVQVKAMVYEGTSSWTYNSATVRQANGATGNKVEFVSGLAEDAINTQLIVTVQSGASASTVVGIGIDSTTTYYYDGIRPQIGGQATLVNVPTIAQWTGRLTPGYHALNWLENVPGAATSTFISSGTSPQAGMTLVGLF